MKTQLTLPVTGKQIGNFVEEIKLQIADKHELFFRAGDVYEIFEGKFRLMRTERFITYVDRYFITGVFVKTISGVSFKEKSIDYSLARAILSSQYFQEALPKIERIFHVPIPILYNNQLTFPKKGYDRRFKSWLDYDAPDIEEISLKEAKNNLFDIFKEFCFKSERDKINAMAGLLSPFLRGLYSQPNVRAPVFFYIANRERAGKDYCANVTGIIYEGVAEESPPVSNVEGGRGSHEELRKKLTSMLIAGKKRFHSSNNKGHIDNAVFEGFVTSKVWTDRILGHSEQQTFSNEIDCSLSGNIGVTYTPDFANRCRFVRLFLDIEDANARQFRMPDLHGWILQNRKMILSSLFALVENWIDKGSNPGTIAFTSFPEWADICGGVFEAAGLDSPCTPDEEAAKSIGGDLDTSSMKLLFEKAHELHREDTVKRHQIIQLIENNELFPYLDLTQKSDQTKLGLKISKFIGRILSGIRLDVVDEMARGSRQEYKFIKTNLENKNYGLKVIGFGHLGNIGNVYMSQYMRYKNYFYIGVRKGGQRCLRCQDINKIDEDYET